MKYAWIEQMAGKRLWWFSIVLACQLLEVSRSGFYDWRERRSRPTTAREREQQLLVAAITVEHIASRRRYGSPRIHAELVAQGWRIGVNRVARLMSAHGIEGRSGRLRRHSLTRQAKVAPDIPDLLQRDFTAEAPDTRWTTDITYVPTAQGWCYLAVLVDLCSKAVVGWAADTHMRTSLVLDALTMALQVRRPGPGLIVHSDRGSQYTSREWLDALADVDARASMGRVGVCWDNAPAESWFGGFKNELVHPIGAFATVGDAKADIARYIRWHNTTRRHSALHMLAPHTWERAHTLTRAA
ncbi:MAG: IS3 family transposase [Thermocrispum sp.]